MADLRTIQKKTGELWVKLPFELIREGDVFRVFEPDGLQVGEEWTALTDGYQNEDSIWTVDVRDQEFCRYCESDEKFCAECQVCGEPGHTRHWPGSVPITSAWCEHHFNLLRESARVSS